MSIATTYKLYDATSDTYVDLSIDRVRREVCISTSPLGIFGLGGRQCWPYTTQALQEFEVLLKERRVPYVRKTADYVALLKYVLVLIEPAGVSLWEIFIDNHGFLRDSVGRLVQVEHIESAARFPASPAEVYVAMGYAGQEPHRVSIEVFAPPWDAAKASWALARMDLGIADKADLDAWRQFITRYQGELSECKATLQEYRTAKKA